MAKRKKEPTKAIPSDPFEDMDDRQTELADAHTPDIDPLNKHVEEVVSVESKAATPKKKVKGKRKKKSSERKKTASKSVAKPTTKKKPQKIVDKKKKSDKIVTQRKTDDQQIMEPVEGKRKGTNEAQTPVVEGAGDPLDELMAIIDGDEKATELEAMLAGVLPEPLEMIPTEQHVVFILAEKEYAIPIANVLEIGQPLSTTLVPFVPAWLLGIANVRGEIISIIDLRTFLDMTETRIKHTHRFMIVRTNQDDIRTGFIVDRVLGSHHLVLENIEDVNAPIDDPLGEFVCATYDHGGRSLIVLDFDRFLRSPEISQFEAT